MPQCIQSLLRQQAHRFAQLFTDDQKMFVNSCRKSLVLPALLPNATSLILKCTNKIPVRNIGDTIHAYAIDTVVVHPVLQVGVHQITCRYQSCICSVKGIIRIHPIIVFEQVTSEALTFYSIHYFFWIASTDLDKKIEKVDGAVGVTCGKGHDHIIEETHAILMAGLDKANKVCGGGRRHKTFRESKVKISSKIVAGGITPFAVKVTVGGGKQFQGIHP